MMTIQAAKFTPEVLLSAPRRSPGVPNATGELVLYTVSDDAMLEKLCSIGEETVLLLQQGSIQIVLVLLESWN